MKLVGCTLLPAANSFGGEQNYLWLCSITWRLIESSS
jgi:hypothetical protein